jgi:hypothetical protein
MAPEQFDMGHRSSPDLHQIDIWALGVLFYEILVAAHPLDVTDTDMYDQMVHKILHNKVRDLSGFGKEVDRTLAEICYRALSKDKEHRYKNGSEMFQDLNQWETANFEKCITLAEEYIGYHHWQEAQRSAVEAQSWSPYHPKIKECLIKALAGQYGVPLMLDWLDTISSEMVALWLKTRRYPPPPCLAQIYYIHNEPPYFIAVDPPRGVRLKEFLDRREAIGTSGVLELEEAKLLLSAIQELLCYVEQYRLPIRGLQSENIYCETDAAEKMTRFCFWGIGWAGQVITDPMEAILTILRTNLSNESIAMDPKIEEALRESKDVGELGQRLANCAQRTDEEDFL